MTTPYKLALTKRAEHQLEAILADGAERWGIDQAIAYYDDLLEHFDQLCDNPLLYMEVAHIKPGYRRSVCGAHSIYYRIEQDMVMIVAILKRQQPETHL
ncbi:type II toxin-antitoxin system RelE/ParE family toxin [Parvularcula marina]|uniref:type II toxin-antitoxin system RelE/ParE family toxin n=1 Tax=Parvularcula marina TaxID=2292771 RepID=UPI00351329F7